MATKILLDLPEFSYLNGMFAERPHPLASRLHYALASVEDDILKQLDGALREEFGDESRCFCVCSTASRCGCQLAKLVAWSVCCPASARVTALLQESAALGFHTPSTSSKRHVASLTRAR